MTSLRSMHFVPAANAKMLQRALASNADALILDLEDSVAPEAKEGARLEICRWLREIDFGCKQRVVRINALATPWGEEDLAMTAETPPDLYMVPKVDGPYDLERIDGQLRRRSSAAWLETGLIPIATETPAAVLRIVDIARGPRVRALTWGAEDLSAALGARRTRAPSGEYLEVFRFARSMALLAAAAAGVDAIDGVFVDFHDLEGLRREAHEAADQGFAGKMTIHPDQIDVVNEVFTPSSEDLTAARALLEAYEQHRSQGRMAFQFKGQMVDAPHLERARRLLVRAGSVTIPGKPAGS